MAVDAAAARIIIGVVSHVLIDSTARGRCVSPRVMALFIFLLFISSSVQSIACVFVCWTCCEHKSHQVTALRGGGAADISTSEMEVNRL